MSMNTLGQRTIDTFGSEDDPMSLITHPEWHAGAPCADPLVDPDIFYPTSETAHRYRSDKYEPARRVCARCPFATKDACLEHALSRPEIHGMWAGRTPRELRKLRGQRGRTAA